jgi:hypothetical protein
MLSIYTGPSSISQRSSGHLLTKRVVNYELTINELPVLHIFCNEHRTLRFECGGDD